MKSIFPTRFMSKAVYVCGLFAILSLSSCSYEDQQSLVRQNADILLKESHLSDYFSFDSLGVNMYKSPRHKAENRVECRLNWAEAQMFVQMSQSFSVQDWHMAYQKDTFGFDKKTLRRWQERVPLPGRTFNPEKPLEGVRIALDPGHLGGSMATAEMEARYIKAIVKKDTLAFNEGTLAWQTAKALEKSLSDLGATVFVSRIAPGYSAFGKTFAQWLKHDKNKAIEREVKDGRIDPWSAKKLKATKDSLYVFNQLFKKLELRERARAINKFQPDATLIIHYNADQDSWQRRNPAGFYQLMDFNYCMAFVPGAFSQGDLNELRDRAEFLRLLVSNHLPESIRLSRLVVEKHQQILGINPADESMGIRYLKSVCLPTQAAGVYARNMSLTRHIKGPLCYGESFCQDQEKIAIQLAKNDTVIAGIAMPKLIAKTAWAYHEALVAFFQ